MRPAPRYAWEGPTRGESGSGSGTCACLCDRSTVGVREGVRVVGVRSLRVKFLGSHLGTSHTAKSEPTKVSRNLRRGSAFTRSLYLRDRNRLTRRREESRPGQDGGPHKPTPPASYLGRPVPHLRALRATSSVTTFSG